MTKKKKTVGKTDADVILIGAGIMSATLGVLLKELEPNLSIEIYERLDIAAAEYLEYELLSDYLGVYLKPEELAPCPPTH